MRLLAGPSTVATDRCVVIGFDAATDRGFSSEAGSVVVDGGVRGNDCIQTICIGVPAGLVGEAVLRSMALTVSKAARCINVTHAAMATRPRCVLRESDEREYTVVFAGDKRGHWLVHPSWVHRQHGMGLMSKSRQHLTHKQNINDI